MEGLFEEDDKSEVQLRSLLLGSGVASMDAWCPTFRDNAAISILC